MRKAAFGIGIVLSLGLPACAQRTGEMRGSQAWNTAEPALRHRIRLNRGFYNLVGQQPNVPAACGPQGASAVRTRSNGWDALFTFVTVGLYTPQHTYLVCNPPATG